jgi:hypothetical protein
MKEDDDIVIQGERFKEISVTEWISSFAATTPAVIVAPPITRAVATRNAFTTRG